MLKVRKLDSGLHSIPVKDGCTVGDLKKFSAEELGIPWWQQQWTDVKEGEDILTNDCALDLCQISEVTCVTVLLPSFPLDHGKFNHLLSTGVVGDPCFAEPDENGILVLGGTDTDEDEIEDAVVLEDRLLTIKGDGPCDQDDPCTEAAWSEEVKLDKDNAPILVGWRVRYISDGWPGPRFGLTTKHHLTTNAGAKCVTPVLMFSPQEKSSEAICSPTCFPVGTTIQKIKGDWIENWSFIGKGKVAEIVDGKLVIEWHEHDEEHDVLHDVDASCVAGDHVQLDCRSSQSANEGEVVGLPTNDVGGFEYDVLVLFDSLRQEIRASVGWGGAGSRIDRVAVPSEMWPSSELPLVPFVSLDHEDFSGMNNVGDRVEQLPITIEALTSSQMAEDAILTLMQG